MEVSYGINVLLEFTHINQLSLVMVVKWSVLLEAVPWLLSDVIHNSLGYLPAQVRTLCISFHLFICSFHFISHIGWSECLLETHLAYYMCLSLAW